MKNYLKVFFLFFTFGLLVYFNSLNNKFLIDDYVFLNNPVLSQTKFMASQWNPYREQVLGVVDNHESLGYYRPTAHMVYDFCYATFKNNYWQYHLLNIFLFVLAASLVFLLIEKLTGNYLLAFLAGFFYLIHPINNIVVNYISASVFAFQVIFMLGTVLLLLFSLERKNDRSLYALSLLSCFLSLFWNESGIMIPFYVAAVVCLFKDDLFKKKLLYISPYFLIVISYLFFRFFFVNISGRLFKHMAYLHMTAMDYLIGLGKVISWYISRLFYPEGIVMQWSTPMVHQQITLNILIVAICIAIFSYLFMRFSKDKILQLALGWFLIGIVPISLAAFVNPDMGVSIEPHWFVFSSIGFFILIAYLLLIIIERAKYLGLVLLFALIFSWGAITQAYSRVWADQKTYGLFWAHYVPDLKSTYFYIADAYHNEGAFDQARKYYKLALAGKATDLEIYHNLGVMDESDHNWKGAELNYNLALKMYPYSAKTYNNLATVYFRQGQWEKAKTYFDRCLALNPMLIEPRRDLAEIFIKQGQYQKAIDLSLKNLEIEADDQETLYVLIKALLLKKDFIGVRKSLSHVIASCNDPKDLTKLGVLLAQNNSSELALYCFAASIHIDPKYKDAYAALGALLANSGMYDDAIRIWQMGLKIDPTNQHFADDIKKVMLLREAQNPNVAIPKK